MATRIISNTATLGASGHTAADDVFLQDGNTPLTTDIDASGLAAGGYDEFVVAFGWKANIGTFSNPLQAEVSTRFVYGAGAGQCWYYPNGDSDVCALLRVIGPGRPRMTLLTGGTITVLECSSGITDVTEPVAATTIRVDKSAIINILDNSSTDPTLLDASGGTVNTARGATTITQRGSANVNVNAETNAIGTWNVDGGRAVLIESGTITTLNWKAGSFDVRQLNRPVTITTANIWTTAIDPATLNALLTHPLVTIGTPNYIMDGA
jgi:hypothetical protein